MKLVAVFSLLICSLSLNAACPDLKTPLELKDAAPKLEWDAAKKSVVMPIEGEGAFPTLILSKVKFTEAPKSAALDSIKNGAFELRIAQIAFEDDSGKEWLSPNGIGFQFLSESLEPGLASFHASFFATALNTPDITSKISKEQDGSHLFDSSFRQPPLEWKVKLRIKGTQVVNIEMTHPVYAEVLKQQDRREFKTVGKQTLCIESYSSVEIAK